MKITTKKSIRRKDGTHKWRRSVWATFIKVALLATAVVSLNTSWLLDDVSVTMATRTAPTQAASTASTAATATDVDNSYGDDNDNGTNSTQSKRNEPKFYEVVVNRTHGTKSDFYYALSCDGKYEENKDKVPTHDDWVDLRRVYNKVMGESNSSLSGPIDGDAFHVPTYIDLHPTMNRGVFAKNFIPNGTRVWTDTYEAEFTTAEQFRMFLINIPRKFACEVLQIWSYYCKMDNVLGMVMVTTLDSSALMNAAAKNIINLVDVVGPDGAYNDLVASRDIEAGEQLLIDYTAFLFRGNHSVFGFAA